MFLFCTPLTIYPYGAPANFNLWGEREHGENSYERLSRESY